MRRSLMCALGILLTFGVQACGEDAERTEASTPPEKFDPAGCHAMIPDSVSAGLGWATPAAPVAETSVQTCTSTSSDGDLTVQRQLVGATGSEDLPAAAEKVFEDTCAVLDSDPAVDGPDQGEPGTSVDWLGPDVPACAVTRDAGASILLARPTDDLVVQVQVHPSVATDPAQVQQALVALQQAAAAYL